MARYSIDEKTLTDIADAVRAKVGIEGSLKYVQDVVCDTGKITVSLENLYGQRFRITVSDIVLAEGCGYIQMNWTGPDNLYGAAVNLSTNYSRVERLNPKKLMFFSKNNIIGSTFHLVVEAVDENDIPYTQTPQEMIETLNNLPTPPTESELIITGNCSYMFYQGVWDWVIEKYGNQITTTKLTNINDMFSYSKIQSIPFELNFDGSINDAVRVFTGSKIAELPKINNFQPSDIHNMFASTPNLKIIPDDYFDNWDFSFLDTATSAYTGNMSNLFNDCKALRKLPLTIFEHGNPVITYSYSVFKDTFNYCCCLDEIIGMPNPHTGTAYNQSGYSSLIGSNFLAYTYRLKNFTFKDMPAVQWANQTLDLSKNAGWSSSDLTQYGISDGKRVNDDATYQVLKDDPDWWSMKVEYSRYNHDSAVRTINSLPSAIEYQTSSGKGANIVKFKGGAGSATDGGAINTLTEEEIAVAIAKGWTVSLV